MRAHANRAPARKNVDAIVDDAPLSAARMFTRARRALGVDDSPPSTSTASSVLTPNVTARRASTSATPSTPSTPQGLYAKASSALREALDGGKNDDGMRYAMINDARRTVQKLSEVLDGGFDAHGLGEDEKDAWLLQVECLREAVDDATVNVAGLEASQVPSPVVREANVDSSMSGMFEGLALAPPGTSTENTAGLDLFSGLNVVGTPPTPKVQVEAPQPISPHVLFEMSDNEHGGSTPQRTVRIGYGRDEMAQTTKPTTAVPDFEEFGATPEFTFARVSRSAADDEDPLPVFDEETSSALVGEFEFAVASLPPMGSIDGRIDNEEDELSALLQAAQFRNKAPELAHRSCEARIEACVKKRSVVGSSAMALLAQIDELKSQQEQAVTRDDYEAAATLEEQISGAVKTYDDTERKLLDLEKDFTSTIEESIKALENLVNAGKTSVEELTIFCRAKDELLAAKNAEKHQAKQAAKEAEEKLQETKNNASELFRQTNEEIGEVKARREALDAPMCALNAEIEDLRAQLLEKESAYEALIEQMKSLDEEEQCLIAKAEITKTKVEETEAEIAKFLEDENVEEDATAGEDEAERKVTGIREGLSTKEQTLASTSDALSILRTFIERESSAVAQESKAHVELTSAENAAKTRAQSQKLIATLRVRINELETAKTIAASEKRFKDAADASAEIKHLTQQIENAEEESHAGDDDIDIDALRAALIDAQRAARHARIARLEEESRIYPSTADAVRIAIDLARIKHRE